MILKRYFLIYKITNLIDNKIYIGAHATYKVNDKYMGSSLSLKRDIKKYGRKSFVKEILFVYDTKEEMMSKEREIVSKEFCMREDTYNLVLGGGDTFSNLGMATVRDKEGNCTVVYIDDPRYLSGELQHIRKGLKISEEQKKSISNANKDKPISEKKKKKISDTLKKKYAAGEKLGSMGTKRTVEFKNKTRDRRIEEVINGTDKRCKRIGQYDMDDNLIRYWNSIGQAAASGFSKSGIIVACKGKRKSCNDYKWKYINETYRENII